eukprot:TRINITY_DN9103_c0_g1_i1.p1 TRINITY_DN9103_c0_g1~~TRINITY_DN9103_c0_g1_i1.p1  ORF type:complete len:195 (-),score=19.79 TRINITY_DN9103_c0_g1_i1:8-592(-)
MHSTINLCEIHDGIFLGPYNHALDETTLRLHSISHILPVGCGLHRAFLKRQQLFPDLKDKQFVYYPTFIEIEDYPSENILRFVPDCINWIEDVISKKGRVYVHCRAGVSRSGAILVAYTMWKKKIGYEEALREVQQKRTVVHPNQSFANQLRLFEKWNWHIDFEGDEYKNFLQELAGGSWAPIDPYEFNAQFWT